MYPTWTCFLKYDLMCVTKAHRQYMYNITDINRVICWRLPPMTGCYCRRNTVIRLPRTTRGQGHSKPPSWRLSIYIDISYKNFNIELYNNIYFNRNPFPLRSILCSPLKVSTFALVSFVSVCLCSLLFYITFCVWNVSLKWLIIIQCTWFARIELNMRTYLFLFYVKYFGICFLLHIKLIVQFKLMLKSTPV